MSSPVELQVAAMVRWLHDHRDVLERIELAVHSDLTWTGRTYVLTPASTITSPAAMITSQEAAEKFRTSVIGPPRLLNPNKSVTILEWPLFDGERLRLYLTSIPGLDHDHARWRIM